MPEKVCIKYSCSVTNLDYSQVVLEHLTTLSQLGSVGAEWLIGFI